MGDFSEMMADNPGLLEGETIWIAGRTPNENAPTPTWSLLGVFKTEQEAIAIATGYSDFVGPAVLGENLTDVPGEWPGAYWPADIGECVIHGSPMGKSNGAGQPFACMLNVEWDQPQDCRFEAK